MNYTTRSDETGLPSIVQSMRFYEHRCYDQIRIDLFDGQYTLVDTLSAEVMIGGNIKSSGPTDDQWARIESAIISELNNCGFIK